MTEENKAVEEQPLDDKKVEMDEKVEAGTEETVAEPVLEDEKVETPLPIVVAEKEVEPEVTMPASQQATTAKMDEEQQAAFKTKWNWGAFSLSLFFAVGNKSYLGLLVLLGFVPFIGQIFALVWAIIYGLNAEKWTLENMDNHYRDEEEFRKVMDSWNIAGLIAFIVLAVIAVLSLILLVAVFASFLHGLNNLQDFNNNYYGN
ncbi:hypothetical protein [Lactococcus termiticola]|uniref:Uncharacterized protein n=1 Tax=Lactococcus termiticola TaxID=2169526 RepID=A0A2R5HEV3_9LACT|nr:hypothetical protein [Lactococcus termiticola]GBG96597.1 hypothetical protein NtB2_00710 [Lactococcus termiticola]